MTRQVTPVLCVLLAASVESGSAQTRNLHPSWSPDGTQVVFVSNRDGNPEVYLADTAGRGLRNLSQHAGLDLSPSWSHDGRRIAFVSNRDGQNDIYVLDIATGTLDRVTSRGDVLTSALAWSPDDQWLAFGVGTHRNANLYLQRLDGTAKFQLTETDGLDAAPAWSPDGRTIAFATNRNGNFDIYVAAADGLQVRNVTQHAANDVTPAWSPLGGRIAFVSDRMGDGQDILVLRLDEPGITRLTFGARAGPD